MAARAETRSAALPALVTLEGVGGVTYGMTPAQVRKRWGRIAVIARSDGNSLLGSAAICAGPMRGESRFSGRSSPDNVRLRLVMFLAGARTDKIVGNGSTLRDLVNAYGTRLIPDPNREPGYGYLVVDESGRGPQPAIAFGLDALKQRVQWVAYGSRSTVSGYRRTLHVDC